jgi:hypothetical protein
MRNLTRHASAEIALCNSDRQAVGRRSVGSALGADSAIYSLGKAPLQCNISRALLLTSFKSYELIKEAE